MTTLPLTFEEREIIERNIKNGMSAGRICHLIRRSATGIQREIRRNGGRSNYSALDAQRASDKTHISAVIKRRRKFSEEAHNYIVEGIKAGKSVSALGRELNVAYGSLSNYIRWNKILDGQLPTSLPVNPVNPVNLNERVTSLELQLEIITEHLKKLKNYVSSKENF